MSALESTKETLTLEAATLYLASRVRVRTPLGASEYLNCVRRHARENYDRRVQVAIDCLSLYRQVFPFDYGRSPAPLYSTAREHEFYRLVHTHCFPLVVDEETDLFTYIEREPRFFLPFIPVRGLQRHDWSSGNFDYDSLDLPYQVALLLMGGNNQPVTLLGRIPVKLPAPAPPLAVVGWSLFTNACRVDKSPLGYLPLAFDLINYKTGNIWLDLPPIGYAGEPWSAEELARLTLDRMKADKYDIAMRTLHNWFMQHPESLIGHAINLWNDASQKEREFGYEGMMTDDLADAGWAAIGNDMVVIPRDEFQRMFVEEEGFN